MEDYKSQFELVKSIFDKWAKELQAMPEGEEKEKLRAEIKKALDRFYGSIQLKESPR